MRWYNKRLRGTAIVVMAVASTVVLSGCGQSPATATKSTSSLLSGQGLASAMVANSKEYNPLSASATAQDEMNWITLDILAPRAKSASDLANLALPYQKNLLRLATLEMPSQVGMAATGGENATQLVAQATQLPTVIDPSNPAEPWQTVDITYNSNGTKAVADVIMLGTVEPTGVQGWVKGETIYMEYTKETGWKISASPQVILPTALQQVWTKYGKNYKTSG